MSHAATLDHSPAAPAATAAPAFPGSAAYWEQRYRTGGNSGAGSYGRLGRFKADVVNLVALQSGVVSAIELGCGDGHQLGLLNLTQYLGFDVSDTALQRCRQLYAKDRSKRFLPMQALTDQQADMSLSLDVIYHLVEDPVYSAYMHSLFNAARQLVLIYASDPPEDTASANTHVRHRAVTRWVAEQRRDFVFLGDIENRYPLQDDPQNESFAHFMLFCRDPDAAEASFLP